MLYNVVSNKISRKGGGIPNVCMYDIPSNSFLGPAFQEAAGQLPANRKELIHPLLCFAFTHSFCFT